jgi:tRNA (adenine22-N1)-methyltransferase
MLELSSRLKTVSEFVRHNSRVADIGTDHAFLPVYLIQNNIAKSVLACDLRKGPLFNAEKTVNQYGLSGRIELRLSDGLDNIEKDEVDDIIICGMGGTLISDILSRAAWLKNPEKRLILQPQSHSEDVRKYLIDNLFEIKYETVCSDTGRIYNCMYAEYTGVRKTYPDYYFYFGSLIEINNDISLKAVRKTVKYLKVRRSSEEQFGSEQNYNYFNKIISEAEERINELQSK